MTFQGIVQNGVIIPQPGVHIPEGAVVSVTVTSQSPVPDRPDRMTEEHRQKLLAALDAIAAMPYESAGDGFGGRDHDQVLYGAP